MNSFKKLKFRLPHALTLLFLIICFFGILSLILSYFGVKTTNVEGKEIPILGAGIIEWLSTIPFGIFNSISIIVFLFAFGSFVYFVVKTRALNAVILILLKKIKPIDTEISLSLKIKKPINYYWLIIKNFFRNNWIIIPIMFFFSVNGTFNGMGTSSLPYYAFIIPIAMAAGFDIWTSFLIIFVGAGSGVMGSTINPFSTLIASTTANASINPQIIDPITSHIAIQNQSITLIDGIGFRFFSWIVLFIITVLFVMIYANKVRIDNKKSHFFDMFSIHKKEFDQNINLNQKDKLTKRKIVITIIFFSSFVIMLFFMIRYDLLSGTTTTKDIEEKVFGSWTESVDKEGKIIKTLKHNNFGLSWFHNNDVSTKMIAAGMGISWQFGKFNLTALSTYLIICSIVICIINKTKEKVFVEDLIDGTKKMVPAILCIGMASGLAVLFAATNLEKLFVNGIRDIIVDTHGDKYILVPLLTYLFTIPISILIPSTSGLAKAIFPVLGKAIHLSEEKLQYSENSLLTGSITGYAFGIGLTNMMAPTYAAVVGAIMFCKIPYSRFLKAIWKYLLLMFVVGFVLIIIGGLLNHIGHIF